MTKGKRNFTQIFLVLIIALSIFYIWNHLSQAANVYYYNTPDSWYYYSLAKNSIFDFSNTSNIIRQYQISSNYNISFPIGWPILISIFNSITDVGWKSALLLNFIFYIISLITLYIFFKNDSRVLLYSALFSTTTIAFSPLITDVKAGHTTLAFSWLMVSFFYIILFNSCKKKLISILLLGSILGACMLIRNETILYLPAIIICIIFLKKNIALLSIPFAFIIYSPNIILNKINTDKFFISDNSRAVSSIKNSFNTDYIYDIEKNIFSDPIAWLNKIYGNTSNFLDLVNINFFIFIILLFAIITIYKFYYIKSDKNLIISLFLVIYSLLVTSFFLISTGYNANRYFILPLFFVIYYIILLAHYSMDKSLVNLIWFAILVNVAVAANKYIPPSNFFSKNLNVFLEKDALVLKNCLIKNGNKNTLILFDKPQGGTDLSYLGALKINSNLYFPPNNSGNFHEEIWQKFIKKTSIDSIYILNATEKISLPPIISLIKNSCSDYYFTISINNISFEK